MNLAMQIHRQHRHALLGGLFAGSIMGNRSIATIHAVVAPQVQRATKYYELRASTLVELIAEFRAAAGTGAVPVRFGLTRWDVALNTSPSFGTRTSCAPERVTLRVVLTTTLPKAVRSTQFSAADAAEWQRFLSALLRHETQHDSIVIAQTTAFLRDVESEANRGAMPSSIEACVADVLGRIERASTTFDAITQHGGTDGAVLKAVRIVPSEPSAP